MNTVLELLKLAAVGIVSGLFSSWLATRDHRHRQWWELKVSAYQSLIEALSDLVYYYETKIAELVRKDRQLTPEYKAKLEEFWETPSHNVRRSADAGSFLFSPKVRAALEEFADSGKAPCDNFLIRLQNRENDARQCLTKLVDCSLTDLRLKRFTWPHLGKRIL